MQWFLLLSLLLLMRAPWAIEDDQHLLRNSSEDCYGMTVYQKFVSRENRVSGISAARFPPVSADHKIGTNVLFLLNLTCAHSILEAPANSRAIAS